MLAAALTLLLLGADDAGSAATVNPSDEVKALILRQADAWNNGDLVGFCAVYADDAVFLSPSGVTRGREQVLVRYAKKYPNKNAMGRLSFEFVELRGLSTMASVVANWKLEYPDKPAAKGQTLIVLMQRGGKWVIVQDASM